MKKIFTILIFFICANIQLADPNGPAGELLIKFLPGTTIGTFSLSVSSADYSWHWENNRVMPDNSFFSHTVSGKAVYTFGSPKTNTGHGDYRISWGLFTFSITTNTGFSLTFQLDLRDENWAELYFPSHDTYIFIDDDSDKFYMSKYTGGGGEQISNGAFIELWKFWEIVPLQSNFIIPLITLQNRIEDGPSTDFGSLWANDHEVPSGNGEEFIPGITNNVQHYTIETYYQNERKYSFKWIPNGVDGIINQNIYSSSFDFTFPVDYSTKYITRNFRTVWPLTIKTNLSEAGGISYGNILFKDPTTDNQFHSYSSAGNGFVKDEAFHNLNEIINNQPNQKYSVKAISPILHNGSNYYWYGGDFNPTTPTDLTISGATTKTAYYKGIQRSDDETAYASSSQRKFVRTDDDWLHNVYSSMGRVWYETSSNNGVTWLLANNGQPLDNGEGKLPSIDYSIYYGGQENYYQVIIVFQEKYGSTSKIKVKYFQSIGGGIPYYSVYEAEAGSVPGSYYSTNTTPVIGVH